MPEPGSRGLRGVPDQLCEAAPVRLTGLDTAFLCLDRDVSPMHLGALATFRPADLSDPGRVAALLAERAQRLPQLRRRVEPSWFPLAAATWAEEPGFCAKDHIQVHHLDRHPGLDGAAGLAAELMVHPLIRSRPLWEFHVIAATGWDRFAVLFKMHHAFGDGLNALEIGLRVLDEFPMRAANTCSDDQLDDGALPAPEPDVLSRLWQAPGDVRDVVEQLTDVAGIAASVLRRARLPAPGSPLLISSSGQRALAVASLDLEQVRRIGRVFGGTVNDVLLAVVTGALRDWLVARGDPVDGLVLRAFIPVSQRARVGRHTGGNRLSGYLCDLPVGEPGAGERLLTVRRAMARNRAAGTSRGPGAIPLLADLLPAAVHRVAAPVAGQGASLLFDLMVTSIPVPSVRFTLDGAELAEVFPMAPLAAGQALVIGLSWYRRRTYVALHADRDGLPDVQRLAEAIEPAAGELASLIE
ncbi:MAG: wax ester/triacylglycerol synthase family O-acyltransferase [Pseudonocardiales bacterium]|nr:wax ester/triacylglycerol synthase family O-acyltransferase [Pseudonocardiales bacterium]